MYSYNYCFYDKISKMHHSKIIVVYVYIKSNKMLRESHFLGKESHLIRESQHSVIHMY